MLRDPAFVPEPHLLSVLEGEKRRRFMDPTYSGPKAAANQVKRISERIAEEAVEKLLAQLPPHIKWINANTIKKNNPGFDYLIDNRVKVQVKGSDWIEQVGWAMKPDADHPSLNFDYLIFVRIGVCLNTNFGRFARYRWPQSKCVQLYVVPNQVVRSWVKFPRYPNKGRVELYWNDREYDPKTKQCRGETREILDYKDQYDALWQMIAVTNERSGSQPL